MEQVEPRVLCDIGCINTTAFKPVYDYCIGNAPFITNNTLCCMFSVYGGKWADVEAVSKQMTKHGKYPCCPLTQPVACFLLEGFPHSTLCQIGIPDDLSLEFLLTPITAHLEATGNELKDKENFDPFIQRFIERAIDSNPYNG